MNSSKAVDAITTRYVIFHSAYEEPIKLNCDIDIDFIISKGGQFSVTNVDKGMAESE